MKFFKYSFIRMFVFGVLDEYVRIVIRFYLVLASNCLRVGFRDLFV